MQRFVPLLLAVCVGVTGAASRRTTEQVQPNDNLRPAGTARGGVLRLHVARSRSIDAIPQQGTLGSRPVEAHSFAFWMTMMSGSLAD